MAKDNAGSPTDWQALLFGSYKRSQGRYARQVTGGAILVLSLIAAYSLSQWAVLDDIGFRGGHFAIGIIVAVIGGFAAYRIVNIPRFADFLIAVEAEMNKVSWPGQSELIKASAVVIFVIFFLAGVLFGFDLIWNGVFWVGDQIWNLITVQ